MNMEQPQDNVERVSQEFTRPDGSQPARRISQPRWKDDQIHVLIAAKKEEADKDDQSGRKDKMIPGDVKWKDVATFCAQHLIVRTPSQCRKRWERLLRDFKSVYDHQKRIPSGVGGYWGMQPKEKKKRLLPHVFLLSWYEAMCQFVSNHRGVNPMPQQMMDSSDSNYTDPQSDAEDDVPVPVEEEDQGGDTEPVVNSPVSPLSASAEFEAMGRRKKQKGKSVAAERHESMGSFMDTMIEETKKHTEHEDACLVFSRQKHFEQMSLRLETNSLLKERLIQEEVLKREAMSMDELLRKEAIAQEERSSLRIYEGLSEMSSAVRMLATMWAPKQ